MNHIADAMAMEVCAPAMAQGVLGAGLTTREAGCKIPRAMLLVAVVHRSERMQARAALCLRGASVSSTHGSTRGSSSSDRRGRKVYDVAVENTIIVKTMLGSRTSVSFAGRRREVKNRRMLLTLPKERSR